MATDLETSIEYYVDLLLYQYINLPKARGVISLLATQALADFLPVELRTAFDLETATGPQLDILGEYIGMDRRVSEPVVRDYFNMDVYTAPITDAFGFRSTADLTINASAAVQNYNAMMSAIDLEDDEYRLLLKLKTLLNMAPNCAFDIVANLNASFPGQLVLWDHKNMSISYTVIPEISRIVGIAYREGLLPKPMGVLISGVFEVADHDLIWSLTSYTSGIDYPVGFSDAVTGWADSTLIDYTDRI